MWLLVLSLLVLPLQYTQAAQILALVPLAAKSHWNVLDTVLQTLVARGHNVTVITPFLKGRSIANYTEVDISHTLPSGIAMPWENIMGECSVANNLPYLNGRHRFTCDIVFGLDEFWNTIRSHKFDLFITELLASSCDSYVSHHLQIPQILVTASHMNTWYHDTFASHTNPAYVSTFHSGFATPSNFVQRFMNFYDYLYSHLVYKWVDREATKIGRKYFGPDVPDADTVMKNTSLVFINGHFTVDLPKPVLPNFVDIGGIHLVPPKPLPQDIKQFIDESPNGVIYFTFGSTVKMDTAPLHIQKAFVEGLSGISHRVLWKYESATLGQLPDNVMIRKWFPQRDILNYSKVDLFISHGGMAGVYEAIDSGIPVLGIPLFFDQKHNIANVVHWGAGKMLDYNTLTNETLVEAINEMIYNRAKYRKNAMELSKRFKDRPRTPKQEIVYWTEYVIKHKGAHHLKSAALKLNRFQYFLLDIIFLLFFALTTIALFVYIATKSITHKLSTLSKHKRE
ncbi:UDP-glucosyltransferase 2-like isoform X2 [Adelges cooleyi]|nr:UDP-glucosyltransferase 2-like isoform X2 [Adelges cooleyi]